MIPVTSKSLLNRLQNLSDQDAWSRFHALYSPWVHRWAMKAGLQPHDADEFAQKVMLELVKALPEFEYNPELGMFRGWLKTIFVNRMRVFRRQKYPAPIGATSDDSAGDNLLDQLADPNSESSRLWDIDHDRFIAHRSMELVEPEFEPKTWQAFWRVTVEQKLPQEVAAELGMTRNNVYQAKRRVLQRVREVREELEGRMEPLKDGKRPESRKGVRP